MPISRTRICDAQILDAPGKRSVQIVSRRSAPDARATITRVTMAPGAVSPRHRHALSEQIWIVEAGEGRLLTEAGTQPLAAGDVVRTPPGETHGVENTGETPLVYLTVTSPPEDMQPFYPARRDGETS